MTKKTKQTAVQWLIEYMTENFYLTDQSLEQFDIALEMEKEQLQKEYERGYNEAWDETSPVEETVTIIDPPSGWKYGFPKPIPQDRLKDYKAWLVEQGYPQSEIDSLGEHFYCRYWNK